MARRKIPENSELEDYWRALGKFVQRYAEVEYNMSRVLRYASGTTRAQAKALFSGTRIDVATSFVKRLHAADKRKLSPWLEKAFSTLGEITKIRDNLLHYGIQASDEGLLNTNELRTLDSLVFRRTITVADLDDLEADVIVVHACLNMYQIEERWPSMKKAMVERERQFALTPWRYKSFRPKKSRGGSRRSTPKP